MSYYKYHVFICTNQREKGEMCCEQSGASRLRAYLKQKVKQLGLAGKGSVRINTAGCLDRCGEGPVMVIYPEETWYSFVDEQDIDEILSEHLQNGRVVSRLQIK
ncbi:MAG: (2Fe-2S) ferredoxin domain-containing protein [Gammaproteobacteria bacterium]|nr:(2Fe-2S) ferredoxin domain-containing protein [Gammaproteobacteria bacterium]